MAKIVRSYLKGGQHASGHQNEEPEVHMEEL